MARVDFFASKPRNIVYKPHFSDRQSKSLEASEGALVVFSLPPIGALDHKQRIRCNNLKHILSVVEH